LELHPFRALRPAPGRESEVACPPYDVMDVHEARTLGENNPDSFIHVIRPDADLPDGTDPYDDRVYAQAKAGLASLMERRVLIQEDEQAIWLYRQTMGEHVQIGFVGCANVDDYASGRIKRHEFTRKVKEDDRTRHVHETGANAGPVFLTTRSIDGLVEFQRRMMRGEPDIHVVGAHDVKHECWAIRNDGALRTLEQLLAQTDAFYIADGHHRAASALRCRDLMRATEPHASKTVAWERFLVVVFPSEQLDILAYNRVVLDLNGWDEPGLLSALNETFEIHAMDKAVPSKRHCFGLYMGGVWKRLSLREGRVDESDAVQRLDVAILQNLVLEPLLGIADPRVDKRVNFIGGIRGTRELERLVDSGKAALAFSMFPTAIDELLDVADAGEVMPPKSTWFEPKLASGLLVHLLDEDM
jgi:uncharacterized protein (DUF1015 family)